MKKILIAPVLIAIMHFGANAQSSQYDQNFKVCRIDDKYHVCSEEDPTVMVTKDKAKDDKRKVEASLRRMDTYVHLGYPQRNVVSNKRNPRIVVSYDDPNGAYKGEETMINDGVQANKVRNVNYLDNSVTLPPVDGGN